MNNNTINIDVKEKVKYLNDKPYKYTDAEYTITLDNKVINISPFITDDCHFIDGCINGEMIALRGGHIEITPKTYEIIRGFIKITYKILIDQPYCDTEIMELRGNYQNLDDL